MPNVTADGITLINFGMGSPNAATVMDLKCHRAESPIVSWQMWRVETQKSDWRLDSADCGDPG
jgi:hypothetical protein